MNTVTGNDTDTNSAEDMFAGIATDTDTAQWRRHGGEWEGPDPPTSVQTHPEIRANPLRSVLYIGGGVSHACIL